LSNSDENVCAELKDDVSMMSNMNGWQCDSCTFLNVEWTLCCEMCNKYNPLCLSLNNITIQEYVNIDVYDNNNNPNLHAEIEDYEILNDSDFDGDDFNDNLQYILIEAVNNNDEKENKNNDDNDNDNGNNVDFAMTHGHFNSYLSVEQKEDGFMIVSYQHINNEKNDCDNATYFKKKSKTKTSFEQYWLEMQKYKKKNYSCFKIKKMEKKKKT